MAPLPIAARTAMLAAAGPRLQFPTSVCFGGQDLRTVYVGSLAMSRLPTFVPQSLACR